MPAIKSPFPGMNPYLQQRWGEVHHRLIVNAADTLQSLLPDDLRARIEARIFLGADDSHYRVNIPDVSIAQTKRRSTEQSVATTGITVGVAEPLIFQFPSELEITQGFLEIRERGGGKVITVIEFISPTNKLAGSGRKTYLKKQSEVLETDASLVEIDLVRGGKRVFRSVPETLLRAHRANNLAYVRVGWERDQGRLFPLPLRDRLPRIPIPLRYGEAPIILDLQALVDRAYVAGRFDDTDYSEDLDFPFSNTDRIWINDLLTTAGLRPA